MEKGKISVIVPVYNGAAWLEECVQSVLAQTCGKFELLILDDSSTDGTVELAKKLADSDPRIRLICREKKGVSSARNQGIEQTDGEYVTFVDADDKIDAHMFEIMLNFLEKENSDLVLCDYFEWDGQKDEKFAQQKMNAKNSENRNNSLITVDRKIYLSDYLLRGNTRCWSILYRRRSIGGVRFRENLTIGEDMMFLMDLLPNLSRISVTDYKGYYYRVNRTGAMLRPFTPSYLDEIESWKLACEMVTENFPAQKARACSILAVSAMLAAGKLSRLCAKQRRQYQGCTAKCRETVRDALLVPGAREELPGGYRIKTALFTACPGLYLGLYHLWKEGYGTSGENCLPER